MSESDRLRERAHQIDMAQNGFSLPWAKRHLSPLLRESADRIAALEKTLRDVLRYADDTVWVGEAETLSDRMKELGIEVDYER